MALLRSTFGMHTTRLAFSLFAWACVVTGCKDPAPQRPVGLPDVKVSLTPQKVTLNPGQEQTFAARVEGNSDTRVIFSVQPATDAGIVTRTGTYTAPATEGIYFVVATSTANPNQSTQATLEVTPLPQVSVVTFPTAASLSPGQKLRFIAKVMGASPTVTWSLLEGSNAGTLDENGNYVAPAKEGIYHVLATSTVDNQKIGIARVEVSSAQKLQLTVTPEEATVAPGSTQTFTAFIDGTTSSNVTWSILEAPQGGQISAAGEYKAAEAGTFHVLVQSQQDASQTAFATVVVPGPKPPKLSGSLPYSPSHVETPVIVGEGTPGEQVELFFSALCQGTPVGQATVDDTGQFAASITVPENSTSYVYGRSKDASGNVSICSTSSVAYVEDSVTPSQPVFTGTTPPSPSATSTSPAVTGTADSTTSIEWFTGSTCAGVPDAIVSVTSEGVFSRVVNVASNTTTVWTVRAKDAAGNVSACSSPLSYTHDNLAPSVPSSLSFSPASPSAENAVTVTGKAEIGATVRIYSQAACLGSSLGNSTVTSAGQFSVSITVPENAVTSLYVQATDAAGNVSPCTSQALSYEEDSLSPAAPVLTGTLPLSPSNASTSPTVSGSAEPLSRLHLFKNSLCTGAAAVTDTVPGTGKFSVVVTTPSNGSVTLSARVIDAAGNSSACSNSISYQHDSMAPTAPVVQGTQPVGPANNNTPWVVGTAEAQARVEVYSNPSCTGTKLGGDTSNGSGQFSVSISVANNSSTSLYARAFDAAGNVSTCSTTSATYVEDSLGPTKPVMTSSRPASGANDNQPYLQGTAEAGSTVFIFDNASCAGVPVQNTQAHATTGSFEVQVTVADNSSNVFYALAIDGAGNVSACSSSFVSYNEISSSVSGTVSYAGTASGGIFVVAYDAQGEPVAGTHLAAPGVFELRNLQKSGSYQISAFMDVAGVGRKVTSSSPAASTSVSLAGALTGVQLLLTEPPVTSVLDTYIEAIYPGDGVAAVRIHRLTDADGHDTVDEYQLTVQTAPDLTSAVQHKILKAGHGEWLFVDNLNNGDDYYFTLQTLAGSTQSVPSAVAGPITLGIPVGARSISGVVNFGNLGAQGPLYVLAMHAVAGGFVTKIDNPVSPQAYVLPGVASGAYDVMAFLDQGNDGQAGPDDAVSQGPWVQTFVPQGITNLTIVPASVWARAEVTSTLLYPQNARYALRLKVYGNGKMPVAATLTAGISLPSPMDFALASKFEGGPVTLQTVWDFGETAPGVGSTYNLTVTLEDGSTVPLSVAVSQVVNAPVGLVPLSTASTMPTFSWNAPVLAQSPLYYEVRVMDDASTLLWTHDLPASSTSTAYNSTGTALVSPLTSGQNHSWSVTAHDDSGNAGTFEATFKAL